MELRGKISEHTYTAKKYTPGVVYHYTVYISEHYDKKTPAALLLMFDYLNGVQAAAMEKLVGEGKAPAFVAVGLAPGHLIPENGGGSTGGAISFSVCWYRNDAFRRGYLFSPSVHSLSGGAELVNYVTKCEPRPIRSYISCGEYESLGYWGHGRF